MSSRFVSGGTIGVSGEETLSPSAVAAAELGKGAIKDDETRITTDGGLSSTRNTEWEAVEKELENERKRREEQRVQAAQGEQRSLYDILQANKAAKQAAFEEKAKLSNQFRALDDDEVDFLDEVQARQRREEERVKRETEEGLLSFRQRQRSGGAAAGGGEADGSNDALLATDQQQRQLSGEEEWTVGRKRKRPPKEKDVKHNGAGGLLRRKSRASLREEEENRKKLGDAGESTGRKSGGDGVDVTNEAKETNVKSGEVSVTNVTKGPPLGLVDYGSDDSDDD